MLPTTWQKLAWVRWLVVVCIGAAGIVVHYVDKPTPKPTKRTITVRVQADGKMSPDQCLSVKKGMKRKEIIKKYGVPLPNSNSSEDQYIYHLRGVENRDCWISFDYDNEVDRVMYDAV